MIREYLNNYYLMEQLIKECDEELEIINAKLYASPAFDTSGIPKNPSPRNHIEDTYIDIIYPHPFTERGLFYMVSPISRFIEPLA